MNLDHYLSARYESPPCWKLVADFYRRECGYQLPEYVSDQGVRSIAEAFRIAVHNQHGFSPLHVPADRAIVLMGKSKALGAHHCGVYVSGRILHAVDSGVLHQDYASIRDIYPEMQFWVRHAH